MTIPYAGSVGNVDDRSTYGYGDELLRLDLVGWV
jgi:hypothetical protein